MRGGLFKSLTRGKRFFSACLILSILLGSFSNVFIPRPVSVTEAAVATIDSDAFATGGYHILSGAQTVFTDDQTGYKFFVDGPGYCVYRKTTDGGQTWSGTTTVDLQTDCISISVWYDKWTPGDTGTSIHIATLDANPDDIWYNRLDTDSDALLLGNTPTTTSITQGGTMVALSNYVTITKSTDGTIYVGTLDGSDSFVMRCSALCQFGGNWSEAGPSPFGLSNNFIMLAPLPEGNILALYRNITLEDIDAVVWSATSSSWVSSTTIDANAPDNATYDVGMAVTVSPTTGVVYLAYTTRNAALGADDQIKTARYESGVWTTTKEGVRYTPYGITNVAIGINASNDDIYIAYSARTTPAVANSANVYWKKSSDHMDTWSFEQGPLNASFDDVYGVDVTLSNSERMYVSWFDDIDNDIFGETIADISPGINVRTTAFEEDNVYDSYSQVTIDPTAAAAGTSHIMSGAQTVFTDDQTGYKFFRDAAGYCVYRKTSDGGGTWSSTTTVDSQTDCHQVTVWYDRWTPGLSSSSIHILTADAGNDDLWYNRLDPSTDTLLMGATPISMTTGQGGSLTEAENYVSITRGTDGTLYAVSNDGTTGPDSYIVECTINCNLAGSWSETGANPLESASDFNILMPLAGGNIMVINRDISTDRIRSKIWNNSTWSSSWATITLAVTENATYDVGMAVTVSTSTNDLYLAYVANNVVLGTDDEIRTARYNGTSWSTTTANINPPSITAITNVAISVDSSTNNVYVAYSIQATANTAATANVFWRHSRDNMMSWSNEYGPVNTSQSDLYGIDLALFSGGSLYASWFDNTADDIFGATLANLPTSDTASTGVQVDTIYASTSSLYVGGVFALYNTNDAATIDVTGITITEAGTIDAFTDIANIKLFYEMDTSAPYDCADQSYDGNESQFGSTDFNGFSGADGTAGFTGSTIGVDDASALCVYPVMDILDSADSSSTIEILIANPVSDVTVSLGSAGPGIPQEIPGSTFVFNDTPTLTHYHWRNDDGSEIGATSKTSGTEDTSLTSMKIGSTTRLRIQVSNEGSSSTPALQYRLEYAPNPDTCDVATGWTDVGAVGGDFDMSNSVNLTEGANTTNIGVGIGGVSDENVTFLAVNGGVRDTTSETGAIMLTSTEFVELEYSIVASTSASEGNTYCFRVTDRGNALSAYDQLPRANIAADVLVTIATTSQNATTSIPAKNYYVGSSFVITENTASRTITSITISENGSIAADTALTNIKLFYDLDTSSPYNCASETYTGGESQFGATNTQGFSGPNGTSTFSGSVAISTTSSMCLYTVLDTTAEAQNDNEIDIIIENPSLNITVLGDGTVSPSITRNMNGETTLVGAVLTQTHYHWRSDAGTELTAASLTAGSQDTAISNISETTPVRLRMQVSNEGSVTSATTTFRLDYAPKISTCSAVTSWIDVGAVGGAWNMATTTNFEDATNTTDIGLGIGGLTNENTTFKTPNFALKDASSTIASTTLTSSEFIETEFSIKQTNEAGFDITYCFRLSNGGTALNAYTLYPELTTSPERDFEIQRGTTVFTGSSITLVAGTDYIAPSASTSAFVRITNSHHTGAGSSAGGATQNSDDVTAYILDPSNIRTSFTIARPGTPTGNTRVSWEIVEFIGEVGSDNEMIVRGQGIVTYGAASLTATTTPITSVNNDAQVVVFITGQGHPDTLATNYNSGQSTSQWVPSTDEAVFTRGVSGSDATIVSYAVVEFTGPNWLIQRSEHTYTSAGVTETEDITPVGSLSRTFMHTQKRIGNGLTGVDEYGHEVWFSSIGKVSYFLQSAASSPSAQTSVAWIIENIQTSAGAMDVTQTNNTLGIGAGAATTSVSIGKTLIDITNASIFTNTRVAGTGTNFPRPILGVMIASTTHYYLWQSNNAAAVAYRTEVVEWPTAGLAVRQNAFRFYVDNNALLPTDPWPLGDLNLGENAVLTGSHEPLGEGERIRIRMSLRAYNATFPAGTRAFKLQYGQLTTSCSAIGETAWFTLGDSASSTIWRGYNATGTTDGTILSGDPATPSDLLLTSFSDVAGTLEEVNNTDGNPYAVPEGDDIEYDWIVEQNGANAETFYCFRMVEIDDALLDGYLNYPQLRTASYAPKTQNWRWYNDEMNAHPTTTLATENVAPVDIENGQGLKLRITVKETKNIARDDVRFKLQFSEYADFSVTQNVATTSNCTATSAWCYVDGGGIDNEIIGTTTLTDAGPCSQGVGDGCGTRNESPTALTGFRHENNAAAEYEFAIQSAGPRVNRVYYFRLYDVVQDIPVTTNDGETYPTLVTEGAQLVFTMTGISSTTVTEGVTLDIDTTPKTLPFGVLVASTTIEGGHRLTVDANGTQGHKILMRMNGDLLSASGARMEPILGTNATPLSWEAGCLPTAPSCFGYHAGDDTLENGSTRFSAIDTFARVNTTTLEEISHSAQPSVNETTDIVYRIFRRELQDAGQYEANIQYVTVPMF